MKHAILATALAALTTLTADAALITWGTAQDVSGDTDVSLNGTLVRAANFGFAAGGLPAVTTIVNGVTFNVWDTFSTPNLGPDSMTSPSAFTGAPLSGLSPNYTALLTTGAMTGPAGSLTLTLGSLTVGATYEFQWWATGSVSDLGFGTVTASAGNAVTLDKNVADTTGGAGQFAIGTFVADATTQAITFASATERTVVNGFQLRDVTPAFEPEPETPAAVPEPGTALAGVMLAGLLGVRRRRESGVIGEK